MSKGFQSIGRLEGAAVNSQILVTLDGIRDDEVGLALHELESIDEVLDRVASILSMLVRHTSGDRVERSHSEGWKPRSRLLELRRSAPGCLSARWALGLLPDARTGTEVDESKVVDLLLSAPSGAHPAYDPPVQDYLDEISDALPAGVWLLLGDSDDPKRIAIGRADDAPKDSGTRDEALIEDLHAIGLRSAAPFRTRAIRHGPR